MSTFPIRLALLFSVLLLVLAACGGTQATWTFSPAPAVQPTPSPGTAESPSPVPSPEPTPGVTAEPTPGVTAEPTPGVTAEPGEARLIELEMNAALQILKDGEQITEIPVTIGETILFRVTNTAGYDHNFIIGPPDLLATNQITGLPGTPVYIEGTREFEWQVPEDAASLEFACTVPGHYQLMHGSFVVES
jgi:hypothetical protein